MNAYDMLKRPRLRAQARAPSGGRRPGRQDETAGPTYFEEGRLMSFRRFCRQWIAPALVGSGITLLVTMIPRPGQSATTLAAAPPLTHEWAAEVVSQATLTALEVNIERRLAELELRVADLETYWRDLDRIADLVPADYRQLVVDTARAHGLDPRALAALGWVESRWNPDVVGAAGEVGIMQILPETGEWIASRLGVEEYDLSDPRTNVNFAAAYLRWLIEEHGSIDAALMAYNAGPAWETRAPVAARSYVDRVRTVMNR